jgi:hypothetical protein
MVWVRRNQVAANNLIEAAYAANQSDRLHGPPHVTDLTGCLRKAWYYRHHQAREGMDLQGKSRVLLGHTVHRLLEMADVKDIKTEQYLFDSAIPIQGTADALGRAEWHDGLWQTVYEFKTTEASSKHGPEKWPQYVEQVAGYCLMADADRGRLYPWHLRGDYKDVRTLFTAWDLEFTPSELRAWREELMRRADLVLTTSAPPPIGEHQTWECDYCPFHMKKGGPCLGGKGRVASFIPLDRLELE